MVESSQYQRNCPWSEARTILPFLMRANAEYEGTDAGRLEDLVLVAYGNSFRSISIYLMRLEARTSTESKDGNGDVAGLRERRGMKLI